MQAVTRCLFCVFLLTLYRTGQIDANGRVIDLDKNKSKLAILEREFKEAEKTEEKRQREELEMRVSVSCLFCAAVLVPVV